MFAYRFYYLPARSGCWFVVNDKEMYLQKVKCKSFKLYGCCGELKVGPLYQENLSNWMVFIIQNDRATYVSRSTIGVLWNNAVAVFFLSEEEGWLLCCFFFLILVGKGTFS